MPLDYHGNLQEQVGGNPYQNQMAIERKIIKFSNTETIHPQ
ncbi:hypothetical protein RMSM_01953 [Rhodopirellula maiorica SM1]|uniref:Uncharacterized protein n=1 Tax=Rhodopirellula maiorica SM1 TaxID=1265738 RepID=M5S0E3_9BACT|nr:hypothetical protein RMSM_01953 [Rhodopirellula maiorica SM1]